MTLVKVVRQTLFEMFTIGKETAAMGICRRGERLGSTFNGMRKSSGAEWMKKH